MFIYLFDCSSLCFYVLFTCSVSVRETELWLTCLVQFGQNGFGRSLQAWNLSSQERVITATISCSTKGKSIEQGELNHLVCWTFCFVVLLKQEKQQKLKKNRGNKSEAVECNFTLWSWVYNAILRTRKKRFCHVLIYVYIFFFKFCYIVNFKLSIWHL